MSRTLLVPDLVLEPGGRVRADVAVELADGKIAAVVDAAGAGERADVVRLPGRLLAPGLVNGHSHAFQRHLRGRVEVRAPSAPEDDFWSWRESMYAAADALDPRGMHVVAEECFDAGRRAGYTTVGEFHYVHHRPDGTPYEEPNELALAVIEAARAVGVRVVLLMAAYARGGAGRGPSAGQRRFCDPTVERYLERVERLAARGGGRSSGHRRLRAALAARRAARMARGDRAPRRRHGLSAPHPRRRAAARGRGVARGVRPPAARASDDCGVLGPGATVVHATHVSPGELDLLARVGRDRVRLPDHRGQSRRRVPAGRRALGARRAGLVRRRFQRAPRPLRGGPRDRGLRAPPERSPQRAGRRRRRGPGAVALALPHGQRRPEPRPAAGADRGGRSRRSRRARPRAPRHPRGRSRGTWQPRSSSAAPPHSSARPGSPGHDEPEATRVGRLRGRGEKGA